MSCLLLIAEISVRPTTVETVNFVASIISSEAVKLLKDTAYDNLVYDADRKYGGTRVQIIHS